MNETNAQQIITLGDIWDLFLRRLVIVLLVTALAVAIFFVYDKATYYPMYQSTATLYIAGDENYEGNSSADAYNTYSLALKVVSDCEYLLSSRSVVDQLIEDMNLNVDFATLQSCITTKNPANTRVLEVTVEAQTPELAKLTVDRLCEIGEEKINDAMDAEHVRLYEYGTLSPIPCNQTPKTTYIIVGAVAAVITFGLCLLFFLLDDRIRSTENIEQLLGLSVLGDIPDTAALGPKGRYAYYRAKRYGAYVYGHSKSKKKGRV